MTGPAPEPRREPSPAVVTAWARLVRTQAAVLARVEADLKAAGFPPLAWYDVLLELRRAEEGRLRPRELETRLLIAQHNISRLIDRLVAAGLVERERCEKDGRGQFVGILPAGLALLERMWPSYREAIRRHVAEKLSCDEEATALAGILAKLLDQQPG